MAALFEPGALGSAGALAVFGAIAGGAFTPEVLIAGGLTGGVVTAPELAAGGVTVAPLTDGGMAVWALGRLCRPEEGRVRARRRAAHEIDADVIAEWRDAFPR